MKFINKYKSPNFDQRNKVDKIKYIILHYTAMKSAVESIKYLIDKKNKVSAHFLINKSGEIFNLVNIKNRAWHAGKSYWKGDLDINSKSIGIEIDNSGNELFKKNQILSLINLINYLKEKYNIDSKNILAHSDIAPYRKIDPGKKFPWKKLSRMKICIMPDRILKKDSLQIGNILLKKSLNTSKDISLFILSIIGYDIELATKNEKNYQLLIKAYQRHYRPSLVNGIVDQQTFLILMSHLKQSLTI